MTQELAPLLPKIISSVLPIFRQRCDLIRLVNSSYTAEAQSLGDEITIPITGPKKPQPVVPGPYSNSTPDTQVTDVKLKLNYWEENPFYLTNKDLNEIDQDIANQEITEAAIGLADRVQETILIEMALNSFNSVGVPGTTPFAIPGAGQVAAKEAIDAKMMLKQWLSPLRDLNVVMDTIAEGAVLGLPLFQNAYQAGSNEVVQEGRIDYKLGMGWYGQQVMPTAPGTGLSTATVAVSGAVAPGAKTAVFASGTLTGTANVGDTFKVSGDPQTYVVTKVIVAVGNAVAIDFMPGVNTRARGVIKPSATGWANNTAVVFQAAHALNFAFDKSAVGVAIRTMDELDVDAPQAALVETMTDPVSGIPLRLELKYEHKRWRWDLSCLWGVKVIRPELIVRIRG